MSAERDAVEAFLVSRSQGVHTFDYREVKAAFDRVRAAERDAGRREALEASQNLIQCAERWHELWAQDQRYVIWENTPEGKATHWAVTEEECVEFASDAFDADKMRDDLGEAERNLISAYETAKYGMSSSDQVAAVLSRLAGGSAT